MNRGGKWDKKRIRGCGLGLVYPLTFLGSWPFLWKIKISPNSYGREAKSLDGQKAGAARPH
jgi:hypothetical protein